MVQVSIIIPTYNRTRWLAQAIDSAINQMSCSVEVIVVDDGSNNTKAGEIAARYKDVIYLYQEKRGTGWARNIGLKHCQGDFIQFLDDDDLLAESSIAAKMNVLQKNPDVDVVYSDLYLMNEQGNILGTYYRSSKRPLPQGDIYPQLVFYNFIPIHSMLWRREALLKAGGFPERSILEDWECLLKVSEKSNFAFVDQPLGYYRLHQGNISADFQKQMDAFTEVQQEVLYSERFRGLSNNLKARVLTKYALKQWVDGDPILGKKFLHCAQEYAPYHPMPWLLSGFMLCGRPLNRSMLRLAWFLRSKFSSATSSRDYFLQKSAHTTSKSRSRN